MVDKKKVDPLGTNRSETSYIDEQNRIGYGKMQWLLEHELKTEPLHYPTLGNTMEVLICGEKGFEKIAADIEAAKGSIDLICWGFDPGMALLRNQSNPAYVWANGEPYGELLKRKASAGVKVRLLVWYEDKASAKQNSLVGYVNPEYAIYPGGVISQTWAENNPKKLAHISIANQRQDYCTRWWREATSGQIPNLEVRYRDGVAALVKASIAVEDDQPSSAEAYSAMQSSFGLHEKGLIEDHATHHQKPILIDYDYKDGSQAVGYIMGLNSVSDYWDTAQHEYDGVSREIDFAGTTDEAAAAALKTSLPISRKPLQDYAARLQGEVLESVNKNFYTAWDKADLLLTLIGPNNSNAKVSKSSSIAASRSTKPSKLAKAGKKLRLQVLRTQPEEAYDDTEVCHAFDKTIKRGYFHASATARHYLYLENQYFFYEEFARHLKANRKSFMEMAQAGKARKKDMGVLHTFVVMPKPEDEGMIPRTYDTLKSLGQVDKKDANGNNLIAQHNAMQTAAQDQAGGKTFAQGTIKANANAIAAPEKVKDSKGNDTDELKDEAMKIAVFSMMTKQVGKANYRDIYIHSKLMMADDHYMTLGSANMNQRSMAADSEINVATDDHQHTMALRKRVWGLMTGGEHTGGDGSVKAIKKTFDDWKTLAENNFKMMGKKEPLTGFIVPFSDPRTSTYRRG
jgi:phosphatidylserine/phosphatidylglycerophosphate/cardiolipin synthase-like enzyme